MSDSLTHPYMWTTSGKRWMVEDLQPNMIDIESIAAGLSKECRFGGQGEGFYSVARHSIILREILSRYMIRPMWIYPLLHDAAEAYMRDMCKPVKVCLPDYNKMEDQVMDVICRKFGLAWPFPSIVKEFDQRIVLDEAIHLFEHRPAWVEDFRDRGIHPLGINIPRDGSWQDDQRDFLTLFEYDIEEFKRARECGWI